MRINSINYNYRAQAQNFKGIKILNPQDKEAVDKMLDGKKAIFDAATEAKDIDIFPLWAGNKRRRGKNTVLCRYYPTQKRQKKR